MEKQTRTSKFYKAHSNPYANKTLLPIGGADLLFPCGCELNLDAFWLADRSGQTANTGR
jgi:hypothetical protein